MVKKVIAESVDMSVFSFLCVLDRVSAIENAGKKGGLVLTFKKNEISTWLNNPDEDYLHDFIVILPYL